MAQVGAFQFSTTFLRVFQCEFTGVDHHKYTFLYGPFNISVGRACSEHFERTRGEKICTRRSSNRVVHSILRPEPRIFTVWIRSLGKQILYDSAGNFFAFFLFFYTKDTVGGMLG